MACPRRELSLPSSRAPPPLNVFAYLISDTDLHGVLDSMTCRWDKQDILVLLELGSRPEQGRYAADQRRH
eukprot:1665682-Rhodomonas_salina.1